MARDPAWGRWDNVFEITSPEIVQRKIPVKFPAFVRTRSVEHPVSDRPWGGRRTSTSLFSREGPAQQPILKSVVSNISYLVRPVQNQRGLAKNNMQCDTHRVQIRNDWLR